MKPIIYIFSCNLTKFCGAFIDRGTVLVQNEKGCYVIIRPYEESFDKVLCDCPEDIDMELDDHCYPHIEIGSRVKIKKGASPIPLSTESGKKHVVANEIKVTDINTKEKTLTCTVTYPKWFDEEGKMSLRTLYSYFDLS